MLQILRRTLIVAEAVTDPALFSATQVYTGLVRSDSDTLEMRKRSSSKWTRLRGKCAPTLIQVISGGGSPLATQERETSPPKRAEVLAGRMVNSGRTVGYKKTYKMGTRILRNISFNSVWSSAGRISAFDTSRWEQCQFVTYGKESQGLI